MFPVREHLSAHALIILAGLIMVSACTVDKEYEINPKDIDLSVTVLEDGLTVPVGNSNLISLESLINSAGEGINDFISTGSDGELILSYNGSASLNDQLAELDLASMAVIDGVNFSESFSYRVGDFDADKFTIDPQKLDMTVKMGELDLVNVQPAAISVSAADFKAGLDGFKDVMSGDKLDLANTIGTIGESVELLKKNDLVEEIKKYPYFPDQTAIPVPAQYTEDLPISGKAEFNAVSADLDPQVKRISNVKISNGAKMTVKLSVDPSFFVSGIITPNVVMDFSQLLKIGDAGKIDLSSMKLSKDSEVPWTKSMDFDIDGLVKDEFEGAIALSAEIPITGSFTVSDSPTTTKAQVNGAKGDMMLNIEISFSNFKIESADLELSIDPIELPEETVSLGGFDAAPLPTSISSVKKIIMDESKPITLAITPKNLDRIKNKKLLYTFNLKFSDHLKIKGAENGILTFSGDLADGAVTEQIVLQEIYPTVSNGTISLDADVKVSASVNPGLMTIDSTQLPQTPDEDLSFSVSFNGEPTIQDYLLVLESYDERADINGSIEVEADGLGDFTGVHVIPQGSPALVIDFNIPQLKGLDLTPGKEGIKITLPEFLVFNASSIDESLNFNESENSILLRNTFPKQVSMPIKELYIKPVKEGGKTLVKGNYSTSGSAAIPGAEISQADLEDSFGSSIGLSVNIPEIKAASISLDDKLSFDINQKFKLLVKNIPDQLKQIDEVLLDDVYVNLEAQFDGLPTSGSQFAVDLKFTLPEFISPNVIPIQGNIINGKLKATPVKLEKLYQIKPNENGELSGDIAIQGSISADGASIDIAQIKPEITASIDASIKNSNGKIAVSKASGSFSYDLEQETTLNLDSMPDMLKSESICLDLADPVLNLDIATNLGIPMTATLELIPYRGNEVMAENTVTLSNVRLPYSSTSATTDKKSYSICKAASSAPAGREFIEADITKILKQLPDYIKVKIIAGVDPAVTAILEPSAKYTLDIDYGVKVPLAFGKDFMFSTDATIPLQSVASIAAMGDFSISGEVRNDSPLNLSAELELLDADGNVIPQSEKSSINIKGASTSPIIISLSTIDKSRAVDSGKITIKVTAIPDKPVKKTDCLQFLNLVAKAKGITVDVNK